MEIRINAVSKAYGEKRVLSGLSLAFPEGCVSCILGPSGCGKTTLLRLIAGLETPDAGAISGTGYKKISAVFQEDRLIENLSAEKNILLTAHRDFTRADARRLMQELGLEEASSKPVRDFSGGMKRRVAIARALAADYDLLLLDEPLSGLDGDTRQMVLDVLLRRTTGRTVLCVTHDEADVRRLNARAIQL